jgi:hypothetical protein
MVGVLYTSEQDIRRVRLAAIHKGDSTVSAVDFIAMLNAFLFFLDCGHQITFDCEPVGLQHYLM